MPAMDPLGLPLSRAAAETTDPLIRSWLAKLAKARPAAAPAQPAGRTTVRKAVKVNAR
jgi:hypothetical protein